MAIENAKIMNVRIRNKYDSYENWAKSSLVLEAGEIALVHTTVDVKVDNGTVTHPALLMKCGNGTDTFDKLPWLSAKAADVLSVCKNEEDLKTFVNGVIADAGIATSDAMEALAGKVTTLEGKMTAVEGKAADNEAAIAALDLLVGDKTVKTQIEEYVAALNLADTYAANVHGHAIADVDGLADQIAAAKKAGTDANAALEAYKTLNDAAVKVNSDAIAGIKNGETLDNFKEVEEALAGKQAAGNYSVVGHKHEIADVNGLSDAIADAKKAGTDAASAAAQALTDAKDYTDSEMSRLVGDTPVGTQITTAINNLDLANTYDAKGAAAAAQAAAEGHADGLNTAMNARVEALEAIDHDHGNKTVLDGITAEKVAAWDAAEGNAKAYADELDEAMDARVLALEGKFTGEDSVADQIADAVAAEAELRENADKALQDQIGEASAEGKAATGLHARIEELEDLVGDDKVSEAIAAAVKVEKERAESIEGGLETRLAAVEANYATDADVEGLQNQINTIMNNPDAEGAINSINEFTKYVADHGTIADGMRTDINKNKEDIAGLTTRMGDAETAIGTKAAQADLEALDERVEAVEGELNTETTGLKARMTQAEADIDALEALVGDTEVATQISDAIEAALKVDGVDKYALASALADAIARIAQNETDIDALESNKANDADLADVAKSGLIDDLSIGEGTVLVFDCGTSAV